MDTDYTGANRTGWTTGNSGATGESTTSRASNRWATGNFRSDATDHTNHTNHTDYTDYTDHRWWIPSCDRRWIPCDRRWLRW